MENTNYVVVIMDDPFKTGFSGTQWYCVVLRTLSVLRYVCVYVCLCVCVCVLLSMCERKSERKYKYALDGACVSLIVEKEKDHYVYESVCV